MTVTKDSSKATNGGDIHLECGTSLAELEYTSEVHEQERQSEEKKEEEGRGVKEEASNISSFSQSIQAIRSSLAKDVVTSNGAAYSTFTSPFETPEAHKSTGLTAIRESERYVSVPMVYCDQTASNRPLASVEKYIQDTCLPLYGNTHTNTSITGSQSTAFVAEARQVVAEGVNAKITGKAALDVVLFAGNGATSCVELLIDCLGVKNHVAVTDIDTRPVVFVGPYEHHSNLLPWREAGCEIVMIPENSQTQNVDVDLLEKLLKMSKYGGGKSSPNRVRMGAFTAVSNVTGKVCDVDEISAILHRYGALAFFDYATGAPYVSMDMNPTPTMMDGEGYTASKIAKDAMFISPHKMIGGVNTPGILIVKKNLVDQRNAPNRSGGGTVFYVTHTHHRFLSNRIERYEGGTPNVVGIMRAGLSFLVKRKVSDQYLRALDRYREVTPMPLLRTISDYEAWTHKRVVQTLREKAPNLIMLGCSSDDSNNHLPIFSFLIKCGQRFLHYNYVCAVLNDLFGIQSRGGCQCAGPYSQHLLGLTEVEDGEEKPSQVNEQIEYSLLHYKERAELLRPGFTRLSLPFKGLYEEEVDFVIKALEWVALHGWALMCQYRCNHRTGEWRHFSRQGKPLGRTERKWLSHYDMGYTGREEISQCQKESLDQIFRNAFENANFQLSIAKTDQKLLSQALKMGDDNSTLSINDELDILRWYVYPKECAQALKLGIDKVPGTESKGILGAIRPVGYFEPLVLNPSTIKRKAQHNNGRSLSSRKHMKTDVKSVNNKEYVDDNKVIALDEKGVYVFRDGEDHAGQASLHEIIEGFDDGELSERCIIFLPNEDEWIPVYDIMEKIRKSNSLEDKERSSETTLISKRGHDVLEEKKPSRGSLAWGKNENSKLPNPVVVNQQDENDDAMKPDVLSDAKSNHGQQSKNVMSNKRRKALGKIKPPAKMMRNITQAMVQWDMVKEGDRLLLGLSGGKDSLSLLHCLLAFKRKMKINFEIEVCTIDPMTPSFDPSPLIPYVESLGLKYHYIRDDIVERANSSGKNGKVVKSLCAFCARMKRGNLYACARENNCNKLVLAQHLDDCAESFLMSVMHNGFVRTMKAHYEINAGDLSVIRPMIYCRESLMTAFAKDHNLPVINENCPACFEEPKERARVKKLLSREETLYPNIYDNIRRSLIPIMHDDSTAILRSYTEEALSKSRREKGNGNKKRQKQPNESDNLKPSDACNKTESNSLISKGSVLLGDIPEEDLIKELARRKALKFKLAEAMKKMDNIDPTGQVCTLDGRGGTIPCRELME